MLLHGEGVEVNKSDLGLLVALDNLYVIVTQYDLKTPTIWTKSTCFFAYYRDTTF
jgi:hypothetical protein